jgi:uncharacterized protein YndB with AHSA1/START domain
MPTKSNEKRRWVEVEALLPGTPEDVWRAIATGDGMTAWFTPTTIEEREGGAIVFDLGDGNSSKGVITRWEPPAHLTYEAPQSRTARRSIPANNPKRGNV